MSVYFQHPQLEAVVGCWRIALHDTEAKELYSLPSYGDVKSTSSVKMGLPAGTYYVKISSGSSWKTSIYTVKVNYTETDTWEKEPNLSASFANKVKLNTFYYGTMYKSSDADWYKFTLSKKGVVSINFRHGVMTSTSSCWLIRVYKADGTTQVSDLPLLYSKGDEASVSTKKVTLPAGTYYVKVGVASTHKNVPYRFKVVVAKPTITTQPKSATVALGSKASFKVVASGTALSYQWYYRTSSSGTWKAISAASGKTANYSLTTAARHDGYQYRCKITNAGGSVYTKTVTLTLK